MLAVLQLRHNASLLLNTLLIIPNCIIFLSKNNVSRAAKLYFAKKRPVTNNETIKSHHTALHYSLT